MKPMKLCVPMVSAAALVLGLCPARPAAGQVAVRPDGGFGMAVPRPDSGYIGMFGNRNLGTTLAPRPDQFGSGIRTSPGGSFLFLARPDGAAAFATPWRWTDAITVDRAVQGLGLPVGMPAVASAAAPVVPYNVTGAMTGPEIAPAAPLEATGPEGVPGAEQGAGLAPPPLANRALLHAGALEAAAIQYVHSPDLSQRLTQIARTRGMLAGQGIDVALSSQVARLQGTVRTAHDRVLLANIAGLEPEVRQVDNRLTVEGQGR